MENKDLTTPQVAKILGVHRNTVAKLVKDGKLNPYRITEGTGRMRFKLEDVEKFRDSEDVGQLQPSAIIMNHAFIVDTDQVPSELSDIFDDVTEKACFEAVLKSGDIYNIFGNFLNNVSSYEYSNALKGKADIWVAETFKNLMLSGGVLQIKAARALSIGIASMDLGKFKKPQVSTLIFHGAKGDTIIVGTIQQFLSLDKGLLIMERKYAEAYFIGFKELSTSKYMEMQLDDTYDNYINDLAMSAFNSESDEDEE